MIIIVVLIGAFVMNAVLVKSYGHLWEKHLDVRVEFQKEPSLEGRDAILTETIYNRKWLFLPVLQVGFQMHRNLRFADGENTSVSERYLFGRQLSENYQDDFILLFQAWIL